MSQQTILIHEQAWTSCTCSVKLLARGGMKLLATQTNDYFALLEVFLSNGCSACQHEAAGGTAAAPRADVAAASSTTREEHGVVLEHT